VTDAEELGFDDDEIVICKTCNGTGIAVEGWDCEDCDGYGYFEI
jgi:DnaJ-class molecular chaperone